MCRKGQTMQTVLSILFVAFSVWLTRWGVSFFRRSVQGRVDLVEFDFLGEDVDHGEKN